MGRRELFLEEKKKLDDEEKTNSSTFQQFEPADYVPLELNKIAVLRFIGKPVHAREDPWDPKLVYTSKIKDDKNGLMTVRWSEDKDWILNKIYTTVLSYRWDKEAPKSDGTKGAKVYKYVSEYPKMVDRVLHNNEQPVKYEGKSIENQGWKPTASVYFNVIDRSDYEWHKENKTFKLIAKKVSYGENSKGEKTAYYESGIPNSLYKLILETVVEEKGDWEDFDIAVKKLSADPFYKVYSFNDERKISDEEHAVMSGEPLTEEERSWKKVDIDKMTPVTRYKTIQNRLGSFIKEVDKNLGTEFYSELEGLVAEEKERLANEKQVQTDDEEPETDVKEETETEAKVEEPVRRERTTSTVVEDKDFWTAAQKSGKWKLLDELKKDYSKYVADIDGDTITYKDDTGKVLPKDHDDIYDCSRCHHDTYEKIPFCPSCGARFKN